MFLFTTIDKVTKYKSIFLRMFCIIYNWYVDICEFNVFYPIFCLIFKYKYLLLNCVYFVVSKIYNHKIRININFLFLKWFIGVGVDFLFCQLGKNKIFFFYVRWMDLRSVVYMALATSRGRCCYSYRSNNSSTRFK